MTWRFPDLADSKRRDGRSGAPDPGRRDQELHDPQLGFGVMPKVTLIGAGSAVFARTVMSDILAIDGLASGVFALVDIDAERLEPARQIAERLVDLSGKQSTLEASTARR